jgi:hypothetical protein
VLTSAAAKYLNRVDIKEGASAAIC